MSQLICPFMRQASLMREQLTLDTEATEHVCIGESCAAWHRWRRDEEYGFCGRLQDRRSSRITPKGERYTLPIGESS